MEERGQGEVAEVVVYLGGAVSGRWSRGWAYGSRGWLELVWMHVRELDASHGV